MSIRKVPLVNNEVYHICNKSIAGFKIFNDSRDYNRMVETMSFYMAENVPCKFSTHKILKNVELLPPKRIVDILSYCLMPTHIHLVLKQIQDSGVEKFVGLACQSYSQYFNNLHARKGPLWEGRFKGILVNNDEQLLHLTRYVHLNPVTANLVNNPANWKYSSYNEYVDVDKSDRNLCNYSDILQIDPMSYKRFVLDHVDYQRQLAMIKKITFD